MKRNKLLLLLALPALVVSLALPPEGEGGVIQAQSESARIPEILDRCENNRAVAGNNDKKFVL